jgi:hypothetical protein
MSEAELLRLQQDTEWMVQGRKEFNRNRERFRSVEPRMSQLDMLPPEHVSAKGLLDMDIIEKHRFLNDHKKREQNKMALDGWTQ